MEPASTHFFNNEDNDALDNYVILRHLFPYCGNTPESLKPIRLVCKKWYQASSPIWVALTKPTTIIPAEVMNETEPEQVITLAQFLQQNNFRRKPPHACFQLKKFTLDRHHFIPADPLSLGQRFWAIYGSTISTLTLRDCRLSRMFTLFEPALLNALPNLERLVAFECKVQRNRTRDIQIEAVFRSIIEALLINKIRARVPLNYLVSLERSIITPEQMATMGIRYHCKLKSLSLGTVAYSTGNGVFPIPWFLFLRIFPNLEKVSFGPSVRKDDICNLFLAIYLPSTSCNLRELNINATKSYGHFHQNMLVENSDTIRIRLNLEKLRLRVNLTNEWVNLHSLLESQAASLKVLQLLNCPEVPETGFMLWGFLALRKLLKYFIRKNTFVRLGYFPCGVSMPQLKELHISDNICENMNFLKLMPNLREFKWIKNVGYEPTCPSRWSMSEPESDDKILENTYALDWDFVLAQLECLETDMKLLTVTSWRKMRRWMPNLTKLKIIVRSDEQLQMIGERWPDLEHFELAHGSNVSGQGILRVLSSGTIFRKLRRFAWKPCSCTRKLSSEMEARAVLRVMELLEKLMGDNFILPWVDLEVNQGTWEMSALKKLQHPASQIRQKLSKGFHQSDFILIIFLLMYALILLIVFKGCLTDASIYHTKSCKLCVNI